MTDLQVLFLALWAVYLAECAFWLRRGSLAFVSWGAGRRFKVRHSPAALANQRGGLLLAPPLPPLGAVLQGHQWGISLSPDLSSVIQTAMRRSGSG